MKDIALWLARLFISVGVLAGCSSWQNQESQEKTIMTESAFVSQISVKETTVSRLDNGWNIGLESIWTGQYVDDKGNEQTGYVARIGVWNDSLGMNDTLEVYQGMVFPIGDRRFQVIRLKPNSSLSSAPGSSNGFIALGQLP